MAAEVQATSVPRRRVASGTCPPTAALIPLKGIAMSRLAQAIRSRYEINRTRRELNRAMANATTPAMRDELILVAQRGGNDF